MKITKRQLKRIIKEEKTRLLTEQSRIAKEARLLTDLDSIASAIEELASSVYGMSGPGTVSGDAGDEIAQDLEMQVERLTALHRGMQAHFESMDSENQAIGDTRRSVRESSEWHTEQDETMADMKFRMDQEEDMWFDGYMDALDDKAPAADANDHYLQGYEGGLKDAGVVNFDDDAGAQELMVKRSGMGRR